MDGWTDGWPFELLARWIVNGQMDRWIASWLSGSALGRLSASNTGWLKRNLGFFFFFLNYSLLFCSFLLHLSSS